MLLALLDVVLLAVVVDTVASAASAAFAASDSPAVLLVPLATSSLILSTAFNGPGVVWALALVDVSVASSTSALLGTSGSA